MKIGYARVSTSEQNLDMQLDALRKEGCEKIYEEKASGGKTDRPELVRMMEHLRNGDTLVINKLDRLGRSLRHLIDIVSDLQERGIELVSLQDNINTASATGRLTFAIFGAFAEFERDIILERTNAGLAAARSRGNVGGRKKLLNDKQTRMLRMMSTDKSLSVPDICKHFGISKASYYNYLKSS